MSCRVHRVLRVCLCVCVYASVFVCTEYGSGSGGSIRPWWSALWSQTPIQRAVCSLILPNSTCYMHTQEIMRLGKQGTAVIHHRTLPNTGTHRYVSEHTRTRAHTQMRWTWEMMSLHPCKTTVKNTHSSAGTWEMHSVEAAPTKSQTGTF